MRVKLRSHSVEHRHIVLLVVLTAASGAVDSASYLGLDHVFTSNMTGNWVVLAFAITGAKGFAVKKPGLSFLGFLVGALIAGRTARHCDLSRSRPDWPVLLPLALTFCALVQLAVMFSWLIGGSKSTHADVFVFLLAVSMGCQGGAVRTLGVSDLPTVVITSTVTGLTCDSLFGAGHRTRWRRRAAAVGAFFFGALVGAAIGWIRRPLSLLASAGFIVGVVSAAHVLFPPRSSEEESL